MSIITATVSTVKLGLIEIEGLMFSPIGDTGSSLYLKDLVRDSKGFLDLRQTKAFLRLTDITQIDVVNLYYCNGFNTKLDKFGFVTISEYSLSSELDEDGDNLPDPLSFCWERDEKSLLDWLTFLHFADERIDEKFSELLFQYRRGSTINGVLKFCFIHSILLPGFPLLLDLVTQNSISKAEKKTEKEGLVYLMGNKECGVLKIGFTTNLKKRQISLQSSNPFILDVIKSKKGNRQTERELLNKFSSFKKKGEWFEWKEEIILGF